MTGISPINQKISKLLQRDYAANFGSDSYIGQSLTHYLSVFDHEFLFASPSYELKWGVPQTSTTTYESFT